MSKTTQVRTRIAPSPTGEDIHIGNLYTALINYAFAKKHNGDFIIRIEDTDRERYVKGAEQKILSSLEAFGIANDEGPNKGGPYEPYRQSERLPLYKKHADDLIASGNAYYCICTRERLDEVRKKQLEEKKLPRYDRHCLEVQDEVKQKIEEGAKHVVRLKVPEKEEVIVSDLIRGDISFQSDLLDDQVLLKSDGYPTYHLGVVVDDHLMNVSHVIRAEEWIPSTPKHVLLYHAFGWDLPVFAHLPILRNPDKSKLSKRKNPVWASWYLQEGYLPEAVLNFLALMGWSHPKEKEIFDLKEFIQEFDLRDVNAVGPVFDSVKLSWMNQQYIQKLTNEKLRELLVTFYKDNEIASNILKNNPFIEEILNLVKTRMETLKDFLPQVKFLVEPPEHMSEESKNAALQVYPLLEGVTDWSASNIFAVLKSFMSENRSYKMPVFYVLFTGNKHGLPLPEMLEILGKEETLKRLQNTV